LLAVVVRVVWAVLAPPTFFVYDQPSYREAALRLLTSGYFAYGSGPIGTHPNAITMPGYVLFLATVYRVFGSGDTGALAVSAIQTLTSIVTVVLVYLLGARIAGPRAAVASGILAALYLPAAFMEKLLFTETLYAALLALALYAGLLAIEHPQARRFMLAGLLIGLATLVRPVTAPVVAIPPAVLYIAKRASLRRSAVLLLTALTGFSLVLAPWWVRNHRLYDRLVPFTTGSGNVALAATYWPATVPDYAAVWPTSVSSSEIALTERWTAAARARTAAAFRTLVALTAEKHGKRAQLDIRD
jgi:4-amino-4-deoxy-L-arabinose transferase-like glycosyltransferase